GCASAVRHPVWRARLHSRRAHRTGAAGSACAAFLRRTRGRRSGELGIWPSYIVSMDHEHALRSLSDDELLYRLLDLLRQSRRVEADLVAHIGEVDARRLYAREAAPSMFVYCTGVLHLSEAEAYLRITVARAAREHPVLLNRLRDGSLHLSGIAKLVPHLTLENREAVLARAAHCSKRAIEELIAELAPRPDVPTAVRVLPQRPAARPLSAIPAK